MVAAATGALAFGLVAASVSASPQRTDVQTLKVSVSGGGHVTSSPAGINCPGTCSFDFKDFENVSLSQKADGGSTFAGWGGDCKGTGGCSVTMDTGHNVTATFTKNPPPPTTTGTTTTAPTTTTAQPPPPPATPGPPTTFDVDDIPDGTPLGDKLHGIKFGGGARVFTPKTVAPISFPHAISGNGCTLPMSFTAALTGLSLYAGVDDTPAPDTGTYARLLGFDANGTQVATSGDVLLAVPGHLASIQTPLTISSPAGNIASATLNVGCNTASHDTGPRTAIADGLQITPNVRLILLPTITIDSPADGAVLVGTTPTFSGEVHTPEGLRSFCVVTVASTTPPDSCNQQVAGPGGHAPIDSAGHWSMTVPLFHGPSHVYAWVRDNRNVVAMDDVQVTYTDPSLLYSLSVLGMEITQSVQQFQLPRFDGTGTAPGISRSFPLGEYVGVRLAEAKRTIVRVFALATPLSTGVGAQLWGYRSSGGTLTPLPGSPLPAEGGDRTLRPGGTATSMRQSPTGSYNFTLPTSWTRGDVTLVAQLLPRSRSLVELNDAGDFGGVEHVLFEHQNNYTATAVAEYSESPHRWPTNLYPAVSDWRTMVPTGDGQLHVYGYAAFISIDGGWNVFDIFNHDMHLVDALCGYSPGPHDGQIFGVFGVGITNDALTAPGPGCLFRGNMAIVDPSRQQTAVAHELGHIMGRPHASGSCNGGFPQPNESWPPDDRGYLNGVGLDTRSGSGGAAGAYKVFYPGIDNGYGGTLYFDYMSYCSGQGGGGANCYEACSWISPTGWTELFNWLHSNSQGFLALKRRSATRRAAQPTFAVSAGADGAGKGDILTVRPAAAQASASQPDARYQLVVRDDAGKVIEQLGLAGELMHVDSQKLQVPQVFGAVVPGNAHELDLMDGATLLGKRVRTLHAPTVTLLAPRAGSRVPGRGKVTIRWRAKDADGGRLVASLAYSSDGGRSYHTVASDLAGSSFRLPASALATSRRARLRITVSDGWNEGSATSAVFVAQGSAPVVTIASPRSGFAIGAKAYLFLSGSALSDGRVDLGGKRLSWYAGKRLLGHGVTLSVHNLPKGRVRIRLVARDALGRTGSATVLVRIQ